MLREALDEYYYSTEGFIVSKINVTTAIMMSMLGVVLGVLWEKNRNLAEWRRWVTLSERIDSVSAMAEHDLYVLEDRLGRLDERMLLLETR